MDVFSRYIQLRENITSRGVSDEAAATLVVAEVINEVSDQFKRLNDMVEKSLKDSQ